MEYYKHRQVGAWTLIIGAGILVFIELMFILAFINSADFPVALLALPGFILLPVLLCFSMLTVTVHDHNVQLAFGLGFPRKEIDLHDVQQANIVRNKWYYGLGIKLIPGGWMWNVSGLDAVELTLTSGRKFRIGTDEPQKLLTALLTAKLTLATA